ncbi:Chorismate synthase [Cordyceps fumosorosea ARSEF 2679]|uniref:chorismate synthase n=1 Tax=Cordyceps fumosorosea (strain ARSEF 2679) TaxID=1081104 RepID=A0A162JJA9_CORFA|nr:Chorismate synthase [Cordyceps fumosorosea ARSEF 2679]OAA69832.1 Chorismate synthase [Cordyceps fumosorosea ARSEF 2679]
MSTFGSHFRVTSAGESHDKSVSCIVDNCPPGLALTEADIQPQLDRRRPGQSAITTPRDEKDLVTIHSGTEFGRTYDNPYTIDLYPRASHADWTYLEKYGIKASSGGGRSSAREAIARVAAGAIAEKWLRETYGVEIVAFVSSVGNIKLFGDADAMSAGPKFQQLATTLTRPQVDEFLPVRCPDKDATVLMEKRIAAHDSTGGTVTCVVRNAPPGLGEPTFDKLEALLGHAMMSIPAVKGFEVGSDFRGSEMTGSQHNDPFIVPAADGASPATPGGRHLQRHAHVAFKPPATISQNQTTALYDASGAGILAAKGRHDPCVVPRVVPIVEGMAALAIADAVMAQHARLVGRQMAAHPAN